ncbi:MAG: hypothetical protein WAX89_04490 [Alphaproteobacteria bacterium]
MNICPKLQTKLNEANAKLATYPPYPPAPQGKLPKGVEDPRITHNRLLFTQVLQTLFGDYLYWRLIPNALYQERLVWDIGGTYIYLGKDNHMHVWAPPE